MKYMEKSEDCRPGTCSLKLLAVPGRWLNAQYSLQEIRTMQSFIKVGSFYVFIPSFARPAG